MQTEKQSPSRSTSNSRLWLVLPLVLFGALAGMFLYALQSGVSPNQVPSVLIGKPVPKARFEPLAGIASNDEKKLGFSESDLTTGGIVIVNFWASWCAPCIVEHPQLMALSQRPNVKIFGVNYKDTPINARRFLGRYGNPYSVIGTDPEGRGAVEWGVYGMPETFVIDGAGKIVYKHIGPLSAKDVQDKILPILSTADST